MDSVHCPESYRTLLKSDLVGLSEETVAKTIEHDGVYEVPRLAEYMEVSHGDEIRTTAETREEEVNELVTAAAKTDPIVTMRPQLSVSSV